MKTSLNVQNIKFGESQGPNPPHRWTVKPSYIERQMFPQLEKEGFNVKFNGTNPDNGGAAEFLVTLRRGLSKAQRALCMKNPTLKELLRK